MDTLSDYQYEQELIQYEEEQKYWDELNKKVEEQNEEFRKKWPDHCTKCGGWGLDSFTEMHGFNHGCGEEITDPCECTENGQCARCGEENALGEECEGPCKFCGWNYDDGIAQL